MKLVSRNRVKRECEILKEVQHPNIVSYLDVDTDPKGYPGKLALVMELMERNLTQYLEAENISLYRKLSLCSDIISALMYLHAKGIVHRDLTSNNVLLKASTAKLGDFGTARYLNDPSSLTELPGTQAYMPSEAYPPNQCYTEALDIFSFGVLAIQIITQERPMPSPRMKSVPDQRNPRGAYWPVPEVDRRKNHIDKIDAGHPLRDIALVCIADQSADRPTANDIGRHIRDQMHEDMKQRDEILEKKLTEKDQEISELERANKEQLQRIEQQVQKISQLQHQISKWEGLARKQIAESQEQLRSSPE